MFVVQASKSYFMPVRVSIRQEDGTQKTHEFQVRYRRHTSGEIDALHDRIRKEKLTDLQVARLVVDGWGEDVVGPDGQPLPFSASALDSLLAISPTHHAICHTFFESLVTENTEAAQQKN